MSRLDVSSSPVKLPYEQTVEEVMVALGTHTQAGLTCHEAQERQQRFGLMNCARGSRFPLGEGFSCNFVISRSICCLALRQWLLLSLSLSADREFPMCSLGRYVA